MRIRFFQPFDEAETADILRLHREIDRFWQHFVKVCGAPPARWTAELRARLGGLDSGLGLEVQAHSEADHQLYILPVAGAQCAPLAEAVAERAPQVWPWNVATSRPAASLNTALTRVCADTALELSHARVRVGVGRGHALEVVVGSHLFQGMQDERALDAAELLVATLLGDEVFDHWIAGVDVVSAARPGPLRVVGQGDKTLPLALSELQQAVNSAIRGIAAGLPEHPNHTYCERADWVLFELEELREQPSSESLPLPDLRIATTMCPEMLKCYLSGGPFASERFSAHGERFCYLQLSITATSDDERLHERMVVEEELDRVLAPGRLGCVVGAGVGETYMYIVVALQVLDPAVNLIVRRVRELGAAHESWLRFFDDEWQHEWVGMYDDTPPPQDGAAKPAAAHVNIEGEERRS